VLDVDTVIFCIGDKVDDSFGLPVRWNAYVKNPNPRFPVDGLSYEAYDPDANRPLERIFVAGWSREASSGLVGLARKDGENGAKAVLEYLQVSPPLLDVEGILDDLHQRLARLDKPVIYKSDLQKLEVAEDSEAARSGLPALKFKSNEEMFAALRAS
jgi:ferredoxin--NADP+ reductase